MSTTVFLDSEKGAMSLFHSLCFWQFCSPLFGFFRLFLSFVEGDYRSAFSNWDNHSVTTTHLADQYKDLFSRSLNLYFCRNLSSIIVTNGQLIQ
jgi:hypothetical protein